MSYRRYWSKVEGFIVADRAGRQVDHGHGGRRFGSKEWKRRSIIRFIRTDKHSEAES